MICHVIDIVRISHSAVRYQFSQNCVSGVTSSVVKVKDFIKQHRTALQGGPIPLLEELLPVSHL